MTRTTLAWGIAILLIVSGLGLGLFAQSARAVTIPPGCRAPTAQDRADLARKNLPANVPFICPSDQTGLKLGNFEQWYPQLKSIKRCASNACRGPCQANNPGAIIWGGFVRSWGASVFRQLKHIKVGQFNAPRDGFAAMVDLVRKYCWKHKKCTIEQVIYRWAPPQAGNHTNNSRLYADTVSQMAGIPVNQVFDPNDATSIGKIAASMSCYENGALPYSVAELSAGLKKAMSGDKVPSPPGVGSLVNMPGQNTPFQNFANQLPSPVARFLGIPQTQQSPRSSSSNSGNTNPNQNRNNSNTQIPVILDSNEPVERPGPDTGDAELGADSGAATSTPTNGITPEEQRILANLPTATTTPVTQSITTLSPTLICLPSPITQGESVLLMWACRDGAYKTEGEGFDTNNAVIGQTTVTPTQTTTYGVTCIDNQDDSHTQARCTIDVARPALALIATPSRVARGATVQLSWKTKDVNTCQLTTADDTRFEKFGREGSATSPLITETTDFTLTCETVTGEVVERTLTVPVR